MVDDSHSESGTAGSDTTVNDEYTRDYSLCL